ncbi:MAG: tyrosine-type recombinase/integrase [Desulfovibrio sp.]|nr:tyrosine-type recombinase/integrase [Desulfovibrio sp.]
MEDLKKLYPHLPGYLQWAVKTAFFLALRPGLVELFGLTWDAFNWRRGIVVIRQGKSGRIKTVVPHPAYMTEAKMRYEADMKAGIPLVCHRGGSKVLSFRPAWLNACKKAGVVMRPYDIRHIAATEMLARGADLAAVAARLVHTNVAATGAFYAHVTAGSQSRAAALMPSLDEEKDEKREK